MSGLTRAFTLIEVLAAVMILSVGIIGVVRAYITLASGIETSAFTVQASYLLKTKMADIEKEAIENPGLPAGGGRSGSFGKEYPGFRWEYTASDLLMGRIDKAKEGGVDKDKEGVTASTKETEVMLTKIDLSVRSGDASGHERSLSLWTYLENYSGQ